MLLLVLLLFCAQTFAAEAGSHRHAIELAREGDTGEALLLLETLYQQQPTQPLLHDLITVAQWHGDNQKAAGLADELLPEKAPSYALRALADAFLAMHEYHQAVYWYDLCARQQAAETDCAIASATALARAEDLPAAQNRLERLLEQNPQAINARLELALIYRWRGWPRRAQQQYQQVLAESPAEPAAHAGLARVWLELDEPDLAAAEIRAIRQAHPEEPVVPVLRNERRRQRGAQMSLSVEQARSESAFFGSREWQAGWRLNSPMLSEHTRAYVRQDYHWARFPEGNGEDTRSGIGLDHRRQNWRAWSEWHASHERDKDRGTELGLAWTGSDHWQILGRVDSASAEVPLRARNSGVSGELAQLALSYRWHERRHLGLSATALNLSDDNRRRALSAGLTQRLATRPVWQLDGGLEIYTSSNSADPVSVSYYNPSSDTSVILSLSGQRQGWQGDTLALRHAGGVHIGTYQQSGFSAAAIAGLRYEHRWSLPRGNSLRYGTTINRRSYDGDGEMQYSLYAAFDWWWRN